MSATKLRPTAAVLLLLAACQPQARRLLLLDLTLSDPAILAGTAEPWHAAGYTVEYRQFYPHLTRADLERYRVVVLLGGREPEVSSDALAAGDLTLLTEWVARGGVVVLGYAGDGEGYFDRWLMNRWLAAVGAGIVIGDYVLEDTLQRVPGSFEPQPRVTPSPASALRDPGFDPVPAGRNHVLRARDERQIVARSTPTAFVRPPGQKPASRHRAPVVAASRVDDGLVVVTSRHALAVLGADYRPSTVPLPALDELDHTRAFLVALARWTRRPAEWASITPAGRKGRVRLVLTDGPLPVAQRPPRPGPPADIRLVELPSPIDAAARRPAAGVPGWIARHGMRVLWHPGLAPSRGELDSLVAFLEVGAFNVLSSDANPQAIAESSLYTWAEREAVRTMWQHISERLQTTSLHWVPAIEPRDSRLPVEERARGIRGDSLEAWCALDARVWDASLAPAYRALAQFAASQTDLIPAIAFDLAPAGVRGRPGFGWETGYAFCDAAYRAGLDALARDSGLALESERAERLAALPVEARYDSLLDSGLLGRYYEALERLVAGRAAALRAEARRIAPDLRFAFHFAAPPGDWFSLGLLRGFSGADAPLLVWSREVRTRDLLARYRQRGINAVHAVGLAPALVPPAAWPRQRRGAFEENDGFWMAAPALRTDSLARLLRTVLSKER